jgi:hypothetical protein
LLFPFFSFFLYLSAKILFFQNVLFPEAFPFKKVHQKRPNSEICLEKHLSSIIIIIQQIKRYGRKL